MKPTSHPRWPAQIKYIVGNEACERFSYYGMRSILAGYITGAVVRGGLGQDADTSTEIIHLFVFANYFMPLLGAWLSDKIIGRYRTILWVSLFYCAGHGVLACSDYAGGVHGRMLCLCLGLALIAFGSGGIKPCVSAFMGDQFKPEQSHLLQKAYGAFYWAINFGSFFSFLVIPWVKDHHGYSLAFAVPGILMAIATFIFWRGTRHYVRVPTNRQLHHAGFFTVFWNAYRAGNQFHFAAVLNLVYHRPAGAGDGADDHSWLLAPHRRHRAMSRLDGARRHRRMVSARHHLEPAAQDGTAGSLLAQRRRPSR
jgi:POT family proton-dependent oligopeptide transporter